MKENERIVLKINITLSFYTSPNSLSSILLFPGMCSEGFHPKTSLITHIQSPRSCPEVILLSLKSVAELGVV